MFTAPHTALEKTFGQMPDIEFSDLRQFSINIALKYFLDLVERFFRVRLSFALPCERGANGCHPAEATVSGLYDQTPI
jgi:hypothetical protein